MPYQVLSGAPPGSVMRPRLFSFMIDDVGRVMRSSRLLVFTDDFGAAKGSGVRLICLESEFDLFIRIIFLEADFWRTEKKGGWLDRFLGSPNRGFYLF